MPADVSASAPTRIFVIGASHHSSPIDLRDRLFVDEAHAPLFYARLREAGVTDAVMISTCDRVEVQGSHPDPAEAGQCIQDLLSEMAGIDPVELHTRLYTLSDDEAIRHVFAVCSALESQVVGEPQVLGQVKAAQRAAADHDMVGPELDQLYQHAYAVAKRVRTETRLGERPVTLAAAAVQVARDLHGALEERSVLMVGLGDIADLITQQLRLAGATRVSATGPSRRTRDAAFQMGCHFVPFDDLDSALAASDIVITGLGSGEYVITQPLVTAAMKARRQRPMLIVDGGVPSDVDPDVDSISSAFRFTLDDLERVVMEGRRSRESEADEAWQLVDAAVTAWRKRWASADAVPALVALRRHFEEVRQATLAENPGADAESLSRLLINRLLHEPSVALRIHAEAGDAADIRDTLTVNRVLQQLFGIAPNGTEPDETDET